MRPLDHRDFLLCCWPKASFLQYIPNSLRSNRVGYGGIYELSGLDSIVKLPRPDLMDNWLFITRRKLGRTATRMIFLIPLHLPTNPANVTLSQAHPSLNLTMGILSGDDLFSAPKLFWSFSNSDLRHLWHSLDSNHLPVPEMLWSTSYSKPLPAVPNLNSAPTFFRDSLSHSRDRVTPTASDIKSQVIKVICDIKGRGWSGSVGNARRWPWS